MADNVVSTSTNNCDYCVHTMVQLAEVSSRLYILESKMDDLPTYIEQVMVHQKTLHEKWMEFKHEQPQHETNDRDRSKLEKDVEALEEKIELIPTYMKELKVIQTTL